MALTNGENVSLFDEESQLVLEVAGKIPIKGFSDEILAAVETKLQTLSKSLKSLWDRRQHQTINIRLYTAFGDFLVNKEESNEDTDFLFVKEMSDKLTVLIQSLPQADLFSTSDCVDGYID